MLALVVATCEGDILSLGKVLSEEVGGAGLNGLAVLHHGFNREGLNRSREAFVFGLFTGDGGDGKHVALEVFVDLVHGVGLFDGFFLRFVGGVAFLPQEFCRAQEDAWAHFPAHDVAPLVDLKGQVAVGFRPTGKSGTDDSFRSRTNDVFVSQLARRNHLGLACFRVLDGFEAVMRDNGTFSRKTFSMLGFLLQVGDRDEHGEVSIGMTRALEFGIELLLDELPNGVAPWFNDHATADFGIFSEVGCLNDLLIPLREILSARWGNCILLCHTRVIVAELKGSVNI